MLLFFLPLPTPVDGTTIVWAQGVLEKDASLNSKILAESAGGVSLEAICNDTLILLKQEVKRTEEMRDSWLRRLHLVAGVRFWFLR